jgi:phosphohistidine phosphatase SixA
VDEPVKLYLVPQGIAYDPSAPGDEDDVGRPVTGRGRDKMKRISRALQDLNIQPAVVLSSPCLCTRQAAEILTPRHFHGHQFLNAGH